MRRSPGQVHRLFEVITRGNVEWIGLCTEVLDRVRVLSLADHAPTLMSPVVFREFGLPYWRREFQAAPREAIRFYHNEGNVTHLLEEIPEMGDQVFNFGWVDMEEAKRRIGDGVCLCGNLNTTRLLLYGSAKEVADASRHAISVAAPGGGFILSSSGGMAPRTPLENVEAMYGVAMKYGRYPEHIARRRGRPKSLGRDVHPQGP